MAAPHQVRIIGGRHRGRRVPVVAAPGLRPTPDRVRETLFNWLGQDLTGAATLDLFAGTGVLTLEALSRGAAIAVAVDCNPVLVRALTEFARKIGIPAVETHAADALVYLKTERRQFDVVFLDPPFAQDPWCDLFAAVIPRIAVNGFVYAEASRLLAPSPMLRVLRHARAGSVHYHLLTLTQPATS